MRKGQISYPFTVTESILSFLLILGIINGVALRSGDFIARETVDLQTERIDNAALALSSVSEGHVEISFNAQKNYQFKYDQGNLTLNYSSVVKSHEFSSGLTTYDRIQAPSEFTEVKEELCIRKLQQKDQEILRFEMEGCSDE